MSSIKISPNQVYGLKEHNRLTRFQREDATLLRFFLRSPGVVADGFARLSAYSIPDPAAVGQPDRNESLQLALPNDLSVTIDDLSNTTLIIQPGSAIDGDLNFIHNPSVARFSITGLDPPAVSNQVLCVRYATTNNEVGTCNIATDGTVKGFGTKFTEILRNENDNPTLIRFTSNDNSIDLSLNINQDFLIESISSDEEMKLLLADSNTIPRAGSGLTYKVVGAFEPGLILPDASAPNSPRDIYNYNHRTFEVCEPNIFFFHW